MTLTSAANEMKRQLGLSRRMMCPEVFFFFFRASLVEYEGSQARGLTGATAAGLCHSHSNARYELHLRPTPQLTATPDP